jgi:hypothetical protein
MVTNILFKKNKGGNDNNTMSFATKPTSKIKSGGGIIFDPTGMSMQEYRKKLLDSGSTYIPKSKMMEIIEKAKMRKTAKKRKTFKEGGLVSGKAQAKKYFKGIF